MGEKAHWKLGVLRSHLTMRPMMCLGAVILICELILHPAGAQPRYNIVDLTELAQPLGVAQCEGTAINERGQIVGFEVLPEYRTRAIFWDTGGSPAILAVLSGDNSSWTHAINDNGVIGGLSQRVEVRPCGPHICIYEYNKATDWISGAVRNLNDLVQGGDPLDLQRCWDVNNRGQYVGFARPAGQPTGARGFLLDGGIVTDLGQLDANRIAANPTAINENRQIVGYSTSQDHAFLWEAGRITDLHNHPSITGVTSRAWDINQAGKIVGEVQFHISQPEAPALWVNLQPINLMAGRFSRPQGVATAINDRDQIVGLVVDLDVPSEPVRAFILEGDQFRFLNDLIPPGRGWDNLIIAWDINDRGQIVGGGMRFGQLGHGFLLTPYLNGDINYDCRVDQVDLGILLANWGQSVPPWMRGDLDGDGRVGQTDLGILLSGWQTSCP